MPTWSAVAAGTERRRSSPITLDRSPRPPGSLPTGPAFGFLLAPRSIGTLRLLVARPAALRCLRLAVPPQFSGRRRRGLPSSSATSRARAPVHRPRRNLGSRTSGTGRPYASLLRCCLPSLLSRRLPQLAHFGVRFRSPRARCLRFVVTVTRELPSSLVSLDAIHSATSHESTACRSSSRAIRLIAPLNYLRAGTFSSRSRRRVKTAERDIRLRAEQSHHWRGSSRPSVPSAAVRPSLRSLRPALSRSARQEGRPSLISEEGPGGPRRRFRRHRPNRSGSRPDWDARQG
jgi:hypothetical protein